MVKISIIVPMYNSSSTISQCINSVMRSISYEKRVDVEVLLVDDGSIDETIEVCEKAIDDSFDIKIIKTSHNGSSHAKNVGICHSTGDYLCFIDSDDYVEYDYLNIIFETITESSYDCIIFGANIFGFVGSNRSWVNDCINVIDGVIDRFQFKMIFEIKTCSPFIWNHVFVKRIVDQNKLKFNEYLKLGEDQTFIFCYFNVISSVRFIDNKIYNYRIRSDSTMDYYANNTLERMIQHLMMINVVDREVNMTLLERKKFIEWATDLIFDDAVHHSSEKEIFKLYRKWFFSLPYHLVKLETKKKILHMFTLNAMQLFVLEKT